MLSVVDIKVKKAADGILKFAETLAATLEGSKNDVNSPSHFPTFHNKRVKCTVSYRTLFRHIAVGFDPVADRIL